MPPPKSRTIRWNNKCRARVFTIGDRVTPLNKYHTHEDIIHRKKRVSKKISAPTADDELSNYDDDPLSKDEDDLDKLEKDICDDDGTELYVSYDA